MNHKLDHFNLQKWSVFLKFDHGELGDGDELGCMLQKLF